ncbi:MAG: thiamine phosphate synthase [Planctomycetota bacterium]|jgi:thiamine-phosphate pyrophosphorylase
MDRATLRILDANTNRASEALRVMEDVARFGLDDAGLSERLKGMRHALRRAIESLGVSVEGRVAARDTSGDVGTSISTESERTRRDLRDVVGAARARATESLRVLEECAKTIDGEAGARLERVRYAVYEIESELVLHRGLGGCHGWILCVLISESLCAHHTWMGVARRALEAGCRCVQLREKDLVDRELFERARVLSALCEEFDASCIVNDRVDVALASGAHGVHVGQDDMRVEDVRRLVPSSFIVGVSCGSVEEALEAQRGGASYVGVGAMFQTSTKEKGTIDGPPLLSECVACEELVIPVLAIGGINEASLSLLQDEAEGGYGVAVSSCVCGAEQPGVVVESLLRRMRPDTTVPSVIRQGG